VCDYHLCTICISFVYHFYTICIPFVHHLYTIRIPLVCIHVWVCIGVRVCICLRIYVCRKALQHHHYTEEQLKMFESMQDLQHEFEDRLCNPQGSRLTWGEIPPSLMVSTYTYFPLFYALVTDMYRCIHCVAVVLYHQLPHKTNFI
jgi:hypothetical protein